jgi:hypothetical protein
LVLVSTTASSTADWRAEDLENAWLGANAAAVLALKRNANAVNFIVFSEFGFE